MENAAPKILSAVVVLLLGIVLFTQVEQSKEKKTMDIIGMTIDASERVYYYSDNREIRVTAKGVPEGVFDVEIVITGNETVNLDGKFMHAAVTTTVKGSKAEGPVGVTSEAEMYVVREMLYTRAGQKWVSQPIPGDSWDTELSRHIDLIKDAEVDLLGSEELNGEGVYVLEIKPDLRALEDYAAEIGRSAPSAESGMLDERITSYKITEWISKESLLPLRTVNEFTVSSSNITTTMTVSTDYYDYNKPVEWKLPDEVYRMIGTA